MRHWIAGCAILLHAPPASAEELVLDPEGGHIVAASINGVPLRLRVLLDANGSLILNRAAARRAKLGRGDHGAVMAIGPVRLKGRGAREAVTIGGVTQRLPVNWYGAPADAGADGVISPGLLPYDRVRLRLGHATASRELRFQVQLGENDGLHVPVNVGGSYSIAARFSLAEPYTIAAGAAAAMMAETHGGALSGEAVRVAIGFGVARPAQWLELGTPVRVGEVSLRRVLMRTGDFLGGHALPSVDASPGLIVVTAVRQRQEALYRMTLGADVLGACVEAEYRRESRELIVRCR